LTYWILGLPHCYQVRGIYEFCLQIGVTLLGLWPEVRFVVYALLLLGTTMVTFFQRCSIAFVLQRMPWNQGREVRLDQTPRSIHSVE
jgi:hypothetical protein